MNEALTAYASVVLGGLVFLVVVVACLVFGYLLARGATGR